jgi:hypothetical protein
LAHDVETKLGTKVYYKTVRATNAQEVVEAKPMHLQMRSYESKRETTRQSRKRRLLRQAHQLATNPIKPLLTSSNSSEAVNNRIRQIKDAAFGQSPSQKYQTARRPTGDRNYEERA